MFDYKTCKIRLTTRRYVCVLQKNRKVQVHVTIWDGVEKLLYFWQSEHVKIKKDVIEN